MTTFTQIMNSVEFKCDGEKAFEEISQRGMVWKFVYEGGNFEIWESGDLVYLKNMQYQTYTLYTKKKYTQLKLDL